MPATTTRITDIRTVAIPASDQNRSRDFYRDVLGFQVTLDAEFAPGQRWIELTPPAGGTTLAIPPLGDAPVGIDTGVRFQTDDAEADHAALKAQSVDVDDELTIYPGVPAMFTLRDPDGNTLYVVERM